MYTLKIIVLTLLIAAGFYIFVYKKPVNIVSEEAENYVKEENVKNTEIDVSNIGVDYLRQLEIDSEASVIEEEFADGSNYNQYLASYKSDKYKIYGLLTVPKEDPPAGGYSAIVFIHGYIPPDQYVTTEKYIAYVDYLARNGFVVFKIDLRGNGNSEGTSTGSYFSSGYTIDAISALKSLQKLDYVNPEKIGMWGHSMAGNAILRAMLVENDIKAGVIWSGAVYSYEDFAKYRLNDGSYVRRQNDPHYQVDNTRSAMAREVLKFRDGSEIDFNNEFWSSASLTKNIDYLISPLQLHHALNDTVVNIGYARDLSKVLEDNNKKFELLEHEGGGHNIDSPYFEVAMERTVRFFKENL
ncbi:alpha/beta hydrolase family protein [Patescibacteria group bacterium]